MENRKGSALRSSTLPVDYLKMVTDVFNANFDAGLKAISAVSGCEAHFEAKGCVFPSEVVLAVSLIQQDQIAATTVHASCDFDPKASSPTIEDLLGACVDALGALFIELLDPAKPAQLERVAQSTLGALDDVPFEWTLFQGERFKVFLKIDKSNPNLDEMADDWLARHDPEAQQLAVQEEAEVKDLFVTGPKKKPEDMH